MTKPNLLKSAYYNSVITNNLLNLFNNTDDLDRKRNCVNAMCNIIDDFHRNYVNKLLMENMKKKLETNYEQLINEGREKEANELKLKIEEDIKKFENHLRSIKKLTDSINIDCKIYNNDNAKVLHINLSYFDLSRMNSSFFKLMTREIGRRYKEHYKDVVINFNNCSIGQDIFDTIKNSRYDKSEKTSEIVKNKIEIDDIKINYNDFFFKDVDLTKYSFDELLDKNKIPGLNDGCFYLMLLKNAINYETLIEVINFIKEHNKEQEILPLNLVGLSVEELEKFYEENMNATFLSAINGCGYNGIKLDRDHVETILNLRYGETYLGRTKGDLHGFDLSRSELYSLCFDGANLNYTNLLGTNFHNSSLKNIIFNEATNFSNVYVPEAMISKDMVEKILNEDGYLGRKKRDLSELDLSELDLRLLNFTEANLAGTTLVMTILVRAILVRANLSETYLSKINLNDADLSEANLMRAALIEANASRANLIGANLYKANLYKVDFSEANLSGAELIKANLNEVNLNKANLNETKLIGASLIRISLIEASLFKANLTETNLSKAILIKADLRKAILCKTNLEGANLSEADLTGVDLSRAKIDKYTNFDGAILENVMVTEEQLNMNESLRINYEKYNNLPLSNLRGALDVLSETFGEEENLVHGRK